MSLDKFGRSSLNKKIKTINTTTRFSFPLTEHGNYDFKNHLLCNVHSPVSKTDGATKVYVDNSIDKIKVDIKNDVTTITEDIQIKIMNAFTIFRNELDNYFKKLVSTENTLKEQQNTINNMKTIIEEIRDEYKNVSTLRVK